MIFLVVPFNNIPLFSKELITLIIYFISLFFRVIAELVIYKILPIILSATSTRLSFNSFLSKFIIGFAKMSFLFL